MNWVLITGGAQRIGREIALLLAQNGYNILIHARFSKDSAHETIDEIIKIGAKAQLILGDLEDKEFLDNLIINAQKLCDGQLFALINNASVFENDNARDFTSQSFEQHMKVNCEVPTLLARDFVNSMGENFGIVINILDQRVFKPNPYFFSYNISKMALKAATKTMAQCFAPNIRVCGIAPGPSIKNIRQSDEDFEKQKRATLLETGSPPNAIAEAALFLLKAKHITGQIIAVDGGQHLMWQTPDIEGIKE